MINILLLLLAVTSSDFVSLPLSAVEKQFTMNDNVQSVIPSYNYQLNEIKEMLQKEGGTLSAPVINKVLKSIKCATAYNVQRNNILTIIDYSLPSNEKRLWVFDLYEKKLLFHTYVSHGIRSGTLLTNYFSNKYDSKASSIGVYRTDQAYYGREGLSLRLAGLDKNFNDNAYNRSVVMHGGWYVEENFIKRYGRPGRSWGCPALPMDLYKPIINTIKDNSLMVIYYPSDEWFGKSKFLTCDAVDHSANSNVQMSKIDSPPKDVDLREPVLFVDINKNDRREEEEPIIVMSANAYERVFHTQVPLGRMLRRQINNEEYVALSSNEFNKLVVQNDREGLDSINFVIPVIIMVRGYYETQMKLINMGKINGVHSNANTSNYSDDAITSYTMNTDVKPVLNLKATNRFIRWVGL
ncbi:murein L,D-transpeptidase catalytic domain family protein [Legionella bononiensis]|uniref:Murein L,D-transpeptidase catalytic domain family protein n=1 Tax=Legionella bononiensis TaxID=2793102 RepID=A0ABS1W753_9GAMM|nr:murein L,D-transpeptidase catalytic domain family protein [Legionella bononiensis]MBL7481270.1 murein L,D-transpeptidase catalytic domain family protein [Legionella bononiensis]MBL7525175.1 murein L,D-transpeptidase catalytic domain family protein [Legionella bononiensis]MBL7562899.1 murein L,D-transpeptidase catalytic domain family protein [Legionella bononiensis]